MSPADLFLVLGGLLAVLGIARLLLTDDLVRRVVGLNVAGGGVLMVIIAVGYHPEEPDPVTHALALTGIVITVSVTAFALALARRVEEDEGLADDGEGSSPDDGKVPGTTRTTDDGAAGGGRGR